MSLYTFGMCLTAVVLMTLLLNNDTVEKLKIASKVFDNKDVDEKSIITTYTIIIIFVSLLWPLTLPLVFFALQNQQY